MREANRLQAEMIEAIRNGGAWFCPRKDQFVKIGYSEKDNCYFARECFVKGDTLEGGAYSFGTDWFDISFHGRYIDIFADAETFRRWKIWYDPEEGTCYEGGKADQLMRLVGFCRQADREALAGGLEPYNIRSTNFDKIMEI